MISTLLIMLTLATTQPQDTIDAPVARVDTLREVEVKAPDRLKGLNDAISSSLGRYPIPKTMSLGDVIDKVAPGLQDKMLHPFAIKERKLERKHKRDKKILEEYDRVKTFKELLDEAIARQKLEDELAERKNQKE